MTSLAHQRPPTPAVATATATTGCRRARQIVAVRRRPRRPATALAVPSTSYCGHVVPIFLPLFQLELETLRRNPYRRKKWQKNSIFIYGTTF